MQLVAGWSSAGRGSSWKLEAAASFVNWRQRPVENQYDGEFKIVKTYNANQMFENFQDQFSNYKFIKQMAASMKGVCHTLRDRYFVITVLLNSRENTTVSTLLLCRLAHPFTD